MEGINGSDCCGGDGREYHGNVWDCESDWLSVVQDQQIVRGAIAMASQDYMSNRKFGLLKQWMVGMKEQWMGGIVEVSDCQECQSNRLFGVLFLWMVGIAQAIKS